MPEPNEGDVFYDIEGFPQAEQRPFEYLHGIYFYNGKEFEFKDFTVKDRINSMIKSRDFWMPFAPIVIDRYGLGQLLRWLVR